MVSTHKNVYTFFSPDSFFKLFSYEENDQLLMTFYRSGGMMYELMERSEETTKRLKIKKYDEFVKIKILPDDFKFKTDLIVAGNKVVLISFKNMIGVVIQDEALAELQRNIHKYIWRREK